MQRELAVAAALDAHRFDDVQRRRAQHLVFPVREGNSRCDNDGVAGVHSDGIEVFHRAHGDGVARAVAHDLELDFLPARDPFFHQDLGDRGKP